MNSTSGRLSRIAPRRRVLGERGARLVALCSLLAVCAHGRNVTNVDVFSDPMAVVFRKSGSNDLCEEMLAVGAPSSYTPPGDPLTDPVRFGGSAISFNDVQCTGGRFVVPEKLPPQDKEDILLSYAIASASLGTMKYTYLATSDDGGTSCGPYDVRGFFTMEPSEDFFVISRDDSSVNMTKGVNYILFEVDFQPDASQPASKVATCMFERSSDSRARTEQSESTSTAPEKTEAAGSSLSAGAVAGIIIAAVVVVPVVIGALVMYLRRRPMRAVDVHLAGV